MPSKGDQNLTDLFDLIEYPLAFRMTYLVNSIVFPVRADVKRDFGLVRAEYILLLCLFHFDDLTAQDVATMSRRPRNTISRAVHRMLDEGYLERSPHPTDGRQARLRITDAGRAMHTDISAYLIHQQDHVLDGLDADERATLSTLLKKAALHAAQQDT